MSKRKIYLLLTRFPDNGSKALGVLTGCRYPHASIGLDEDLNTFYSFVTKGFIIESITRYIKPGREPFPCQLYEFAVSERVYCRVKEILQYFIEFKKMMRYTRLGLIMGLLHIPYKRDLFCYFCSEFVADVLRYSGAAELEKESNRYFSEDLKRLPGMKLHFQGNMKTMIKYCGITPTPA